jgi:O-antigen/teichoic acid export membrane protein
MAESREAGTATEGASDASRRVARNVAARTGGELVAKLTSIAFFVVMARELGRQGFGDFTFAFSLTSLLLVASGFGTEDLIAREVARDHRRAEEFLGDVATVKFLMSIALVALAVLIATLGDHPPEAVTAVYLVGTGIAFQTMSRTWYALLQAFERMEFVALALIVERTTVAVVGIAVLLSGGGLVTVSIVVAAGAALGLLVTIASLHRFVAAVRWRVSIARWLPLIRAGVPIGLAYLIFMVLLRLDTVLLGLMRGGEDNSEVGVYGAAFRLLEGTFFVSAAVCGATMPWFARQQAGDSRALASGFELGLKLIAGLLMPFGVAFAVRAEDIVDLVYGSSYAGAALPLAMLGVTVVAFGINNLIATALTARDRPGRFVRIAIVCTVENVALNLLLIPRYGADAAAFNAALSGVLLVVLSLREAGLLGRIRLARALGAPVAGGLAMAAVALIPALTVIPALLLGGLTYVAGFLLFDHAAFPADLGIIRGLIGRRMEPLRRRPPSSDHETTTRAHP